MPSFLDNLPYYRLKVRMRAGGDTFFNQYPGGAIAGALKSAILQDCPDDNAKQTGRPRCDRCESRADCMYIAVMEPPARPDSGLKPYELRTPPPPFVVKYEFVEDLQIARGEDIDFELVLLGPNPLKYGFIAAALQHRITFGPHPVARERFDLREIRCVNSGAMLFEDGAHRGEPEAAIVRSNGDGGDGLTINYLSPYHYEGRARSKNRTACKLTEFGELLYLVHKRAERLYRLYGDYDEAESSVLDRDGADMVRMTRADLNKAMIKGNSRRNGKSDLPFYIGSVAYRGDWSKWSRLLAAGEVFHFGKQTPKGYGWYRFSS